MPATRGPRLPLLPPRWQPQRRGTRRCSTRARRLTHARPPPGLYLFLTPPLPPSLCPLQPRTRYYLFDAFHTPSDPQARRHARPSLALPPLPAAPLFPAAIFCPDQTGPARRPRSPPLCHPTPLLAPPLRMRPAPALPAFCFRPAWRPPPPPSSTKRSPSAVSEPLTHVTSVCKASVAQHWRARTSGWQGAAGWACPRARRTQSLFEGGRPGVCAEWVGQIGCAGSQGRARGAELAALASPRRCWSPLVCFAPPPSHLCTSLSAAAPAGLRPTSTPPPAARAFRTRHPLGTCCPRATTRVLPPLESLSSSTPSE